MADYTSPPLSLDHNGQLPITTESSAGSIRLKIDLKSLLAPEKLGWHFENGLELFADDSDTALHATSEYNKSTETLEFPSTELPADCNRITLKFYGQPIVAFDYKGGQLVPDASQAALNQRLLVDELRMIADHEVEPKDGLPIKRALFEGFNPADHAPITDLHTHSSAQLSAADVMDLALKHDLNYPVELLEKKLGIELNASEKAAIVTGKFGLRFSPGEAEGLACEKDGGECDVVPLNALTQAHRDALQNQLKIDQDEIICFSDFDREYYRFVNPIVKNSAITKDMILKIARDYAKNGVKYAELSTASMLNLDEKGQASWFKEMIEAVDAAEKETGVKLRFLISVPRNYSQPKVLDELDKIKYAARHPLIAGVDLVGYEFNQTSDFKQTLEHIARWARESEGTDLKVSDGWNFQRDFTIRIHAGETGKNSKNVADAVKIAETYDVPVRISHAIHEEFNPQLDAKIRELSHNRTPALVSMEFCAPSNIAYNNIQDLKAELEKPYKRWLKCCKNWFLGSDGAGAIQTTPAQMALSALATGAVHLEDLKKMRANEEAFIDAEALRFAEKKKAYEARYPGGDAEFLDGFAEQVREIKRCANPLPSAPRPKPKPIELPKAFDGKMPIMVAGASGDSIADLKGKTPAEIKRTMHMLVAASDPKKVYFLMGRSKRDGVTAALDEAIMEHNKKNPTRKFEVLVLTAEGTKELPASITKGIERPGGLDEVPDILVSFMEEQKNGIKEDTEKNINARKANPGICIFIGGGNFTSHMIRKCKDRGLDYFLMENAQGASQNFANKTQPSHRLSDGKGLLSKLASFLQNEVREVKREIFPESLHIFDKETMDSLVNAAAQQTHLLVGRWPIDPNAPKTVSPRR